MDFKRCCTLVDELAALDVFGIVLAGGEPFLHPEILDIIEYCVRKGIQVGVLTNGVRLTGEVRSQLERIVRGKRFILQVSLDSVDPRVNDRCRGRGTAVLDNLRALTGSPVVIQIATVLTRYNVDVANQIIGEFYPAVKRYHFLNVQRTETALQNDDLLLAPGQARQFWLKLNEYAKQFPPDLFLPSLRIMMRTFGGESRPEETSFHRQATFSCRSCSVGLTHINIDSDFNVLGCDIAKNFTFMGNVRNEPFAQVWNSFQAYQVRNAPFPPCYRNMVTAEATLEDLVEPDFLCDVCHPAAEALRV
jgi:MoaA/NifB/PqqE/SkfB family radical SAM enzyme